jgi:regulator of sigma E protease
MKFDNDINMKVVLGKSPYRKKRNPANHKMPIDFIDQLSKFEKGTLLDIRRPFVIGAVTDESTNKDLQAKDVVVTIMVKLQNT